MPTLLYTRLIGYTAGTLLMLFWMVVILGYRRQRNFERVFFFLCLALFFFYSGSLLALNAQIYYAHLPPLLSPFAWTLLTVGLCFAPALLLHLHLEYAGTRGLGARSSHLAEQSKSLVLTFAYAAIVYFALKAYPRLVSGQNFDFLIPATSFGPIYGVYLGFILGASSGWEWKFRKSAASPAERRFHFFAAALLGVAAILVFILHVVNLRLTGDALGILGTSLTVLPLLPFAALIYAVEKHNFLQIGRQTNLMYAISVTFLALLYLSLVRRLSGLLEPILPPEATAAILLFVLVIFVEPMQRALGRRLHETAQQELDAVRQLISEVREKAREGDLNALVRFVSARVCEKFEFASAALDLHPSGQNVGAPDGQATGTESFAVVQPPWLSASLTVRPHGAMLSGETRAALEFLSEQLPAALDLCRLIEEKLYLERELGERERLAALGQMAASISHNLKNPLGSIRTILQVQLESPDLPEPMRPETQLMLDEISRLSAKLSQLLQFSRPAVPQDAARATCDPNQVAREIVSVMSREAAQKQIALELNVGGPVSVAAPIEAVRDIFSNLVVNALDAAQSGGRVQIFIRHAGDSCRVSIEDDGPGIPAELREKVLEPFFTTKARGTGLGLAIVARRVAETGGSLEFESPLANCCGTRFSVALPLLQPDVKRERRTNA